MCSTPAISITCRGEAASGKIGANLTAISNVRLYSRAESIAIAPEVASRASGNLRSKAKRRLTRKKRTIDASDAPLANIIPSIALIHFFSRKKKSISTNTWHKTTTSFNYTTSACFCQLYLLRSIINIVNIILVLIRFVYRWVIRPVLFQIDPERVHDGTVKLARLISKNSFFMLIMRKIFVYNNKKLEQTIDGVKYLNPIGLSAGFDKEIDLVDFIPNLGMGFMEVGSITKESYGGNSGTRLWRLKKSKSILVNYGLKNLGADKSIEKLNEISPKIPVGINIAKTNSPETCDIKVGIEDYAYTFKKFSKNANLITINISCPNTYGDQPFLKPKDLEKLLIELEKIKTKAPVYLKLSPDISQKQRREIAKLSFQYRVHGFVCSNLTKGRDNKAILEVVPSKLGGMSGKVVDKLSDGLIKDMYQFTRGEKTIIASGGVFNADDAYKKIKLGASLIEMITGLIYEGPQVVSEINLGLVKKLEQDSFKSVKEAVGANNL